MSDIALRWDPARGGADFVVDRNDLAADTGLETAVFLSLFLDRRAEDGDVLPDGAADRRGWWADAVPAVAGDRIGSRLWLLARSKESALVLRRAEEYAREALAWMLEDRVAARVDVTAVIVRTGVLGLTVSIQRPAGASVEYRYSYAWTAQEAGAA